MPKSVRLTIAIGIFFYLCLLILVYTDTLHLNNINIWRDTLYFLSPVFTGIISIYAWLKLKTTELKNVISLLALGHVLWAIGELIWTANLWLSGNVPEISLADLFYISGYVFVLLAILIQSKIFTTKFNKVALLVSSLVLLIMFIITYHYGISVAYDSSVGLFANLVNLSYSIVDLMVILSGVLLINTAISQKKYAVPWLIYVSAMVATWVGDILYAVYYVVYNATFAPPYRYIDFLWIIWYLLIALSLVKLISEEYNKSLPNV